MTIDEVIALIPDEQREAAHDAIKGLNPLSGVKDADAAVEFIRKHEVLQRGGDKLAQQAVESHKRKFEEEKLPELRNSWKDEVRKELNPEETPEQKRLRELEDQLKERDARERSYQLRDKLRAKAKEIGFDEELAERFVNMQTDDHEAELKTFADRMQARVQAMADEEVKKRWPGRSPKVSSGSVGKITRIEDVPAEWTPEDYARAVESGQVQLE